MKTLSVLLMLVLLTSLGCKSTKVVGNTVYQSLSFPSGFGSYRNLIVTYPMGQTNLQQVISMDSVPGPVPSMFNAGVKSAAFVWGAHELRNVGRSEENNSVRVSNKTTTKNTSTANQVVNAPGSKSGARIHRGVKKW